jgi:probable FeS assembly SUF system protein SufT
MYETATLTRDCEAIMIPSGTRITLQSGNQVTITQALGGSYTVMMNGAMARIDGKDADAIGKASSSPAQPAPTPGAPEAGSQDPAAAAEQTPAAFDEKLVWDQMKTCYDPEIPVNIVDLGLIYDCKVNKVPEQEGMHDIEVKMTLTAPGCGMGEVIKADVDRKIRTVPGVRNVNVELVWEPNWNQGMMSEAARLQLGLM